jgi:FtsZ-binding cell division protein ZapB
MAALQTKSGERLRKQITDTVGKLQVEEEALAKKQAALPSFETALEQAELALKACNERISENKERMQTLKPPVEKRKAVFEKVLPRLPFAPFSVPLVK